jgi:protein-disulfide isomerase
LLEQVLEKNPDKVKLVYKNYPLRSHKYALKAAAAALAAGRQGKFWEFHDALYKDYRRINDEKIQEIALKLGLDTDRFEKDSNDPAIFRKIRNDANEAVGLGVKGIPTVYINGKKSRNRTLADFQETIDKELKKISTSTN